MVSKTVFTKGFYSITRLGDGVVLYNEPGYEGRIKDYKAKSWVRTPGFAHLRATGATLPDNAFSYAEMKVDPAWGTAVVPTGYYQDNYWMGPFNTTFSHIPSSPVYPYNGLNGKLIKYAKGQQWNAPVFLAEAGKTVAMVTQRAEHLAYMAFSLRKGDIVGFLREFHRSAVPPGMTAVKRFKKAFGEDAKDAAANAWLEYKYGWMPFLNDVRDATNTLMDVVDRPASKEIKVRSKVIENATYYSPEQLIIAYSSYIRVTGWEDRVSDSQFRGIWKCRVTDGNLPGRFGLLNPLEVAWELVPFSFVADWFLPVGSYLSALDVPLRFVHVGGSYGCRVHTKQFTRVKAPSTGFNSLCESVYVQRIPMTVPPSLELPSFGGGSLSLAKMFTSISLLNQQVSRLDLGYRRLRL
jgi:hypothetical protein